MFQVPAQEPPIGTKLRLASPKGSWGVLPQEVQFGTSGELPFVWLFQMYDGGVPGGQG